MYRLKKRILADTEYRRPKVNGVVQLKHQRQSQLWTSSWAYAIAKYTIHMHIRSTLDELIGNMVACVVVNSCLHCNHWLHFQLGWKAATNNPAFCRIGQMSTSRLAALYEGLLDSAATELVTWLEWGWAYLIPTRLPNLTHKYQLLVNEGLVPRITCIVYMYTYVIS